MSMNSPRSTPLYLDHAATTPLLAEARAALLDGFAHWANPSSPHAAGRTARALLEEARGRIKAALEWDGEVILTSGASEALALAIGIVIVAPPVSVDCERVILFPPAKTSVPVTVPVVPEVLPPVETPAPKMPFATEILMVA